jgi:hypothetical protein
MSVQMDFVYNADGLQQAFNELSAKMRRGAIRKALIAYITIIANAVRDACPEDTGEGGTGLLKASIGFKVSAYSDGWRGSARVTYGNQALTAARVEFGHENVGHMPKLKKLDSMTPPHPFIWPAVDASFDAAYDAFFRVLDEEVAIRG